MLSNAPPPPAPLAPEQIRQFLDYESDVLRQRRDELIAVLKDTISAYDSLTDDDLAAEVGENLRMAGALSRTLEDRRKTYKKPFLSGGQVVDDWVRAFADPLRQAVAPVQKLLDDWGSRRLRTAREAARAEHAAAQAEAERLRHEVGAALSRGETPTVLLQQAADAAEAAEKAAARAEGRSAPLTRNRGIFGAVMSVRERWEWTVTDLDQVPREFLMVDPAKMRAAMEARDDSGKPTASIPGIAWTEREEVRIK
jgi:hypothetical protein